LQHPPELVPALLTRVQEAQADIVVGSRKADIFGPLGLSRKRAMTSQLLTLLARAWFPRLLKNVSDPLTGLFLVRRAALNMIVLRPDGFKILLEILIRCPGLRVSEIQFDFAHRHEGESKADFQEGMRFFRHLRPTNPSRAWWRWLWAVSCWTWPRLPCWRRCCLWPGG